jgi:peptidoglycan/xylan/chitin deacetylase (PgdA/CDA1 family)
VSRSALVLTYHRVADSRDPLGQCVRPDRFAQHLDVLERVAEIVPLAEIGGRHGSRVVALTFDDGYACNARTAAPILRASAAAATFFVPSRLLEDRSEYWWDRLEHAHFDGRARLQTLDVEVSGKRLRVDIRDDDGRLRSIKALSRRLRVHRLSEIDRVVANVARTLAADAAPACADHALLDHHALRGLAADPLFEIGSHAASHTMLSALTAVEQELELSSSRTALATVVGYAPAVVAYPFGTSDATNATTVQAASRCGYRAGYLNTPGRMDARGVRGGSQAVVPGALVRTVRGDG